MKPQAFTFFGKSGSGKGTQADLLIDLLRQQSDQGVLHIESGALLRAFIKESNSYTSKKTKEILDKGGLLPAHMPIWLWGEELNKHFTGEEHIVFDGTPRRILEAQVLDSALSFYGFSELHVVYLNVSNEWATERLLVRGRYDDTKEDINERLGWFEKDIMKTVEYYHQGDAFHNFHDINGEQTIEEVHTEILEKLNLPELQ